MLNRRQKDSLARLSYKMVEIAVAGALVAGALMSPPPLGIMILAVATIPVFLLTALALESEVGESKDVDD